MKTKLRIVPLFLLICTSFSTKSQVPVLNSYPSASATILLDFDGQYVSGTMWNVSGPMTCNPSGLTNTQITQVFNRVAEDFRPFNINVTTSETVYSQAPYNKRIRIIITTSHEWYGTSAGGVAFLNSFSWGDDTPAFVFSALQSYSPKNIAEAVSHETGHTLGLRHQSAYTASCSKISDYNWGQGTGEIGWAPIMGAGYNQNMTLWHSGPNSLGCGIIQSDLSIITNATNGFGFRTDDHSNVAATATVAAFASDNTFTINGVIEKTDDLDMFKFTMPAFGEFQLDAIPYNIGGSNIGSDLDLLVDFMDGSQTIIGSYNPGNILSSVIDTFINAGTYYLRIDGKGNIYAPEYGSLGSYSLQAKFTDGSILPLRRLALKGRSEADLHLLSWTINASESVINQQLEVSADGRNFSLLDAPGSSLRSYSYKPPVNKPLQYRLRVTFDNDKQYYSNVITIPQNKKSGPRLIGNIISGDNLQISSPDTYQYQIFDQNGRMIQKGIIENGSTSLSIRMITHGMFIIRFSNADEQWSEKFIKR